MTLKNCFVISPIGSVGTLTRKNSDKVLNNLIKLVTEQLEIATKRVDTNDKTGIITKEILNGIISSDLIIVDLTDLNPNVMYELGISHAINKPTILMKNELNDGHSLPFDTQNHNTIFYNLDSLDDVKQKLKNQIEGVSNDTETYNPIDIIIRSDILLSMFNYFHNFMDRILKTNNDIINLKIHDEQNNGGHTNYYEDLEQAQSLQNELKEIKKETVNVQKIQKDL
jgi:hypothetical protein